MKKITFALMAAIAIFFSSCGSKSGIGGFVPEDAAIVMHINSPSLSSKLSWKEIRETEWFKEMQKEANDSVAQKILQDPDNSGVDTQKDFIFFIRNEGRYSYISFQGSLKDEAAFETFCKHVMKAAGVEKKEGISVIKSDGESIISWKNNHFILLAASPNITSYSPWMRNRSMDEEEYDNRKLSTDSLISYASSLYSLKAKNSLASDNRFASLVKETGDLHFWMNGGNFYSGMLNDFLSLTKLSTLLDGNVQTGTVNFDNGKISIKSKAHYNKELSDFYKKYAPKNIDADALTRISSQNVIGVMAMNYPPEGVKEFIKLVGADGFTNSFLGEIGYSLDEFVKANKGDLILSVSDLDITKKMETYPGPDGQSFSYPATKTDIKVLFATSINDKPAFDKLVSIAQEHVGKMAGSEEMGKIPEISFTVNDKWFVAGNSKEQVDAFTTGGKNNHAFIEKLKGHPMGFYLDLQKIFNGIGGMAEQGDSDGEILEVSKKMWQEVVVTGNMSEGNIEISLVDKNTNSLKHLNGYFNNIAQILNARKKRYTFDDEGAAIVDSVLVKPVPAD